MNLIPTKKALPLFSVFPKSQNESPNLERSFYSRHANYFIFNQKNFGDSEWQILFIYCISWNEC